jgi:RimJ/RimL family protein N-acetyltransferase
MFAPTYPLETARLRIRPYRPDDLESLLAMFGREDVSRFLMWEPLDRAAAAAMLERRMGQSAIRQEGEGLGLVVEERDGARFVGEVVLRWLSEVNQQGEIGWSVDPATQGRGYATEAAREMLRLGFDELRLHRIIAECDPRNTASIRVMEKLGMRREAHHLEAMFVKGEWCGSIVSAMLASEWRSLEEAEPRGRGSRRRAAVSPPCRSRTGDRPHRPGPA